MAEILIIDDDEVICDILAKMMSRLGHRSRSALTGQEGLNLSRTRMFDIVFLDVNLPDANGLELIKKIKITPSSPEIIIITGESDPDGAELAINSGAWNYLEKPFLRQELSLQVSRALQFRKEKGAVSTPGLLKRNNIVGDSEEINLCLNQVSTAAYGDSSVLISGETGTGKELFAKVIHLNSDRCENNFVVVDCGAINETIVESILLGHKKGAFAGAVNDRVGLIEQADKGTLFLDEIAELPWPVQKTLLRVLEEKSFKPVGSDEEIKSDFRIIVSTAYDLDQMSDQGQFRKDLMYRLKGINISLPTLKDIQQDIVKIAIHYIEKCC
ncbi:MAG: sigma-54-dependent Fis family transcriptional regulator, partial [Desulfobacteraceae bacterium]|nr:sigma-54-dependent Fis family transcriptional regulator [Desulfobacteraceae bacterium]